MKIGLLFCFILGISSGTVSGQRQGSTSGGNTLDYYGTYLGPLRTNAHGVSGEVYAVDENTIFIKNFNYDGQGPDAYFWTGNTVKPDPSGAIIPDEKGSTKPLGAYRNQDLVLRLPEGRTLRDIRWISVWCRKFTANFADLLIPRNLPVPTPVQIAPLSQLDHGVKSGPITIVDAQTLLIPDFHYDGEGPAGYWWATKGPRQSPQGVHLNDENGTKNPLRRYSGETVVITLPEDKTIWDFNFIGVWCEKFNVDFGNTKIPHNVRVPPSPRMLGVKPESKLNCEVLHDGLGFEIRWVMDGDDIVMQLVGRIDPNEYMSFGLGKVDSKSDMIKADAVVTWYDRQTGKSHVVDYYLESKQQCVGTVGSCPDTKHPGASDSYTLLHGSLVNGFTMITFKRPQLGVDEIQDQHIYSDGPQAVLWAVGPLNNRNEVSYHRLRTSGDLTIDFARTPKWNCPNPDSKSDSRSPQPAPTAAPATAPTRRSLVPLEPELPPVTLPTFAPSTSARSPDAWDIPPVICPSDNTFRAQIGPTGGRKGYQAITGNVGWGIAWYINGLLIPELTVQRGKTYTFIVEGGNDPENSARRHPMYITDSPEGGFDHKTAEDRQKERVFAGVGITSSGQLVPTAEGRLCSWKIDTRQREKPEDFSDFFSFQRTLRLECQDGQPGILTWTPDRNTPDTVYYQCYTHRLLGWKIRVVDNCDYLAAASMPKSVIGVQNVTAPDAPVRRKIKVRRKQIKQRIPVNNVEMTAEKHIANDSAVRQPLTSNFESVRLSARDLNNRHSHGSLTSDNIVHAMVPAMVFESPQLPGSYIPNGPVHAPFDLLMPPMFMNPQFAPEPFLYLRPDLQPLLPPSDQVGPALQADNDISHIKNKSDGSLGQNLHGGFVPVLINATPSYPNKHSESDSRQSNQTNKANIEILFPNSDSGEVGGRHKQSSVTTSKESKTDEAGFRPSRNPYFRSQKKPSSVTFGRPQAASNERVYTRVRQASRQPPSSRFRKTTSTTTSTTPSPDSRGSQPSSSFHNKVRIAAPPVAPSPVHNKSVNNQILKATVNKKHRDNFSSSESGQKQPSGHYEYNSSHRNHKDVTTLNAAEVVDDVPTKASDETSAYSVMGGGNPYTQYHQTMVNNGSNATDDVILSHIMSLIAEGATPPEVKISSKQTGPTYSTHVEFHHKKIVKRSADLSLSRSVVGGSSGQPSSASSSFGLPMASSSIVLLPIVRRLSQMLP